MASSNITGLTNLATPQPTMLLYAALSPFGVTDDRKITANALLATITANISDLSVQFDNGLGTATVSAAGKGKLRYNNTTGTFQFSANGAAYAEFGGFPGGSNKQIQFNNSSAFGGATGFEYQSGATPLLKLTSQSALYNTFEVQTTGGVAVTGLLGGGPALLAFHANNATTYWSQTWINDATTYAWGMYLGNTGAAALGRLVWDVFNSGVNIGINYFNKNGGFSTATGDGLAFSFNIFTAGGTYYGAMWQLANDYFNLGRTTTPDVIGSPIADITWSIDGVGINKSSSIGAQLHVVSDSASRIAQIVASAASPSVDIFDARQNATNVFQLTFSGALIHTTVARTSGILSYHQIITPADTGLTASTESIGIQFGGNSSAATVIRTWATGALTTQRECVFVAPTYAFVGASTITTAATVAITGAPVAGTNATITNAFALDVTGATRITGKLTVTGAIDPTSLSLSGGTALYFESADGSTAAVSASNQGRIRYNSSTQTWQMSMNGAAYTDIAAAASSGISIGGTVTGGTTGSVLFVGAGPVLAQDNSNFFWDDTNNRLGIGVGSSPSGGVDITGVSDSATTLSLQLRSGNTTASPAGSSQITLGFGGTATYRHSIRTRHNANAQPGNDIDFFLWKQGTDSSTTIGTQHVMTLAGDGFVGIGNSTPTALLTFPAATGDKVFLYPAGSSSYGFGIATNQFQAFAPSSAEIALGFGNAGTFAKAIGFTSTAISPSSGVTLAFPAETGSKITLYGGIYGIGLQANLLQIFTDNSSHRVGIGYGSSASFTEVLSTLGSTVGVNRTSPGAGLHVVSPAAGTVAAIITSVASPSVDILEVQNNATNIFVLGSSGAITSSPIARTSGSATYARFQTPADTGLAADTEAIGIQLGGNSSAATVTRQFTAGGGAFATQREVAVIAPTYGMTSADTITTAFTLAVSAAPIAGTNATITNPYAFGVQSGEAYIQGMLKVGSTTTLPTRQLELTSASTSRVALYVTGANAATVDLVQWLNVADDTSTVANLASFDTSSDGTAANGFGASFTFQLESSTTGSRTAAVLQWLWSDATDATRTADLVFQNVNSGTVAETFRITGNGLPVWPNTVTSAGTTGNQTINKPSGTVNIAAAGTTVTVTNSLVTANSIVFAVIRTADATARIANVVPASGSFVINIVACTAEVSIGWFVINK